MLKNIVLKTVLIILVFSFLSFDLSAKRKKQYFNETSFEIDFDITHKIIPLEVQNGGNKEIVIIGVESASKEKIEEYKNTIVAIYQKVNEGLEYELLRKIALPKNTIAFDIIKLYGDKNCLLLLNSQQIQLLHLDSSELEIIANIGSIYLQDEPQFISKKKMVKDLNGDGLDDIIIPNFKYVNLLLQQKNSLDKFLRSTLPIKAVVGMNSSQISFSEQKYFIQDVNFDGLNDFLLVKEGKLTAFIQKELGQFSERSEVIELPFKFSGLPWWLKRGADGETADQSNLKHSMLEDIQDINGDSIPDIMVKKTVSSGVLDRENSYDFFFGFEKKWCFKF